jgi:hypothetical protein
VVTTFLVTPKLKLEANPLARKLKWPFAVASLGLAFLPYWSVPLSLIILVPSLLVSASNASGIWIVRAVGESEYFRFIVRAAASAKVAPALLFTLLPSFFVALLGYTIQQFYPNPTVHYGYYIGLGVYGYALVLLVYRPLAFLRLRKIGRSSSYAAETE